MNKLLVVIILLVFSCSSTSDIRLPEKLDLSKEKEAIQNSPNIPTQEKKIILDAFEKTEDYCNSIVLTVNDLAQKVKKLESKLLSEKEDAEAYRRWRFRVFAFLVILFLWETRNFWFPIIRKLIGSPI